MRHAKNPTAKVSPRLPQLEVAEQGKKNLLDNLFPVVERESPGNHVTKEGIAKLLKEMDDLAFVLRRFRRSSSTGACWESQLPNRLCLRYQHGSSYIYSLCLPVCSRFFRPLRTKIHLRKSFLNV